MLHPDQVTGVVLAGGKSSRFSSNKALCEINGSSFLQHITEKIRPSVSEIVISGSRREYNDIGIPILADEFEDIGPLGGIYTALKHCATPWLIVFTCDMPLISNQIITHLFTVARNEIIIGWGSDNNKGLFPLLISKDALDQIREMIDTKQYKIKKLLQLDNTKIIDIPQEWQYYFTNINTNEDYKQITNVNE